MWYGVVLVGLVPTLASRLTACTCSCCEASVQSFLRSGRAPVCTPLFAITQSSCPGECNDLQVATAKALHDAEWDVDESAVDYSRFCLTSCSPGAESLCTPSLPLTSLAAKPDAVAAEGLKASAAAAEAQGASAAAAATAAAARAAAALRTAEGRAQLGSELQRQLAEAAERTGAYAEAARGAVKMAEQELKEMEDAPRVASEEATKQAIRQLKQQEQMNLKVSETLKAHLHPSLPSAGAAAEVAAPYKAAMREAERTQGLFKAKAAGLADEAEALRAGAALRGGVQAHELLVKSLKKETEASEAMAYAERAREAVSRLTKDAATAVTRASILGSAKWMPPSPLASAPAPAPA